MFHIQNVNYVHVGGAIAQAGGSIAQAHFLDVQVLLEYASYF